MSPLLDLEVDMEALDETNVMQAYWKLFPYIARDFLTIADFHTMMGAATAPTPAHKLIYIPTSAAAASLQAAYKAAIKTGAAARKGLITGLEKLTGG